MKEMQADHSRQLKEKDRLIKQAKGERDSLYEELKSTNSMQKGTLSRK